MKLVNAQLDTPHAVRTEWSTTADPGHLFWALTEGLADWLGDAAATTSLLEPGATFCIDAGPEWGGRAHYGRFVELRHNRRIVAKWISESLGGIESDVTIDLEPTDRGTDVCVEHVGPTDSASRADIGRFWLGARHALDEIIFAAQQPTA